MAHRVNRQILLKSRPEGAPSLDNFELTESPVREPGEGEVLTRTLYLSLDPYQARPHARGCKLRGQCGRGGRGDDRRRGGRSREVAADPTFKVGDIVGRKA